MELTYTNSHFKAASGLLFNSHIHEVQTVLIFLFEKQSSQYEASSLDRTFHSASKC